MTNPTISQAHSRLIKYKFLGHPDWRFPKLKHGKIYELVIIEQSRGLFGWLVGNTKPLIIKPIRCPYSSWHAFWQNWKQIV